MTNFVLLTLLSVIIPTWQTLAATPLQDGNLNNRPIIAVLAQRYPQKSNQSYIAASYVKYLEGSGARVVPIPHYFSANKVAELFNYVNGVLLPGGGVNWFTSDFYKNAKQVWELAIAANDNGIYFPIWGTCLGFEALNIIRAGENVLSCRVSSDRALALDFTEEAKKSRLFKDAPEDFYEILGNEKVTFNHHSKGVTRDTYKRHPKLDNFFKILSVNKDMYGLEFISTVEAYKYPIYGVQWHPEKNNFEFTTKYNQIPHSRNGVRTSQYMANFFVDEARKNSQKFPSKEMESKYLIYKYKTTYSGVTKELDDFEQVYYFGSR